MSAVFLLLALAAQAADITLEPGNDVAALTSSLSPGHTITFNAGTYMLDATLSWNAVGDETNPITFKGNGTVVLESQMDGGGAIIRLFDSDFVVIENLTLRGATDRYEAEQGYDGLRINNSSNVEVRGLTIEYIGDNGIEVGGGDMHTLSIEDNVVAFVRNDAIVGGCGDVTCTVTASSIAKNVVHDTINGDGIELQNGSNGNVIRDNILYNIAGQGIQSHSAAFGEPNQILANAVWQSTDGIWLSGAALVQNNVVFNLEGEGIVSEDEGDSLEKVRITFNTVYNTGEWGVRLEDWRDRQTSDTLLFANNAITNTTGQALQARPDHVDPTVNGFSHNIITGFIDADELTELDGHYQPGAGAADYSDPVGWDFYPTLTSTLVNAGGTDASSYIPSHDFVGVPREGDQPDVGAYERCRIGDGNANWQIREDFKELDGTCDIVIPPGGGCCSGSSDTAGNDTAFFVLAPLLFAGLRRRRRDA